MKSICTKLAIYNVAALLLAFFWKKGTLAVSHHHTESLLFHVISWVGN